MRPALERLLARPQSLDLLRYLFRTSAQETRIHRWTARHGRSHGDDQFQQYASVATPIQESDAGQKRPISALPDIGPLRPLGRLVIGEMVCGVRRSSAKTGTVETTMVGAAKIPPKTDESPKFGHDFGLWNTFLKENGETGVLGLWDAIKSRDLVLPTEGRIADSLWSPLLDLGAKDRKFLGEICDYADAIFKTNGKRWSSLYTYVMRLISNDSRKEAVHWHNRLVASGHTPGSEAFRQFMRVMVFSSTNPEVVKTIYVRNKHRNAYSKIMKTLVHHVDLRVALDWHLFLTRKGDFPHVDAGHYVEVLLDYLIRSTRDIEFQFRRITANIATCDVRSAVTDVEAVVEHSAVLHVTPRTIKQKMTVRELINLSEGEAFHIAPKKYNDGLCARWLATKWISLDFAIKSLSSLGIPNIGPLSLQAIALREPDTASVLNRISQLRELGVSIGTSVFSRAVLSFAHNGQEEYLTALLESDQHPDALEDGKLQQNLLSHYALLGDWAQYRRTVAVQLAVARDPQALSNDMALKRHATTGSWSDLFNQLEKMDLRGVPVQQTTAHYIVACLLGRRSRGKGMINTKQNWLNLEMAINIMTLTLERNGRVSPLMWREIFRRLGLLGRLDELERLSLWLASWYGMRLPTDGCLSSGLARRYSRQQSRPHNSGNSVSTLRILFPPALQRSIVEWSFIHTNLTPSISSSFNRDSKKDAQIEQYARGVRILRGLRELGVEINMPAVRSALRNRLVVIFGHGTSLVSRNRVLQAKNLSSCEEILLKLDREWGEHIWAKGTDGAQLIAASAEKGMRRRKEPRKKQDVTNVSHRALRHPTETPLTMSFLGEGG